MLIAGKCKNDFFQFETENWENFWELRKKQNFL
jgi:hypothetical protein